MPKPKSGLGFFMPQETEIKTCLPAGRDKSIFLKTLALAWELGYSIAIPLVVFAFSGRLLDKKYESSPFFLLSGILLAIVVSGAIVFKKTKNILEEVSKK